jgi:quercetin dioxygenase-like cupin family protein
MNTRDFTPLLLHTGVLLDLRGGEQPALVRGWCDGGLRLEAGATHFGVAARGDVMVRTEEGAPLLLGEGTYFVLPGAALVAGQGGAGLVISRPGYAGLRQFGGPLEREGRLRYIDGCSDTLLVCPPRRGEPCLNHLHVPPGIVQSAHTHPSARIGVILRGRGECRTAGGAQPLAPGMGWYIPAGCVHAFATGEESLDVVAWHPDSDFGPTDENHPMINRTRIGL